MSSRKKQTSSSQKKAPKNRAAEIANTFEWLITALILAFLFRAFIMEAFRIPTGSMADTLKGAHFRLRCPQCGYKYDYGFIPEKYGFPRDYIPHRRLRTFPSRCPNCGSDQPTGGTMSVANGDRILVLKCIYQFFEPKRWDVVVFKDPLDPTINYIKRLIAKPGETVEIIDGDVYINGKIARKPPKVQKEMWMPVHNNDYQPVLLRQGSFNQHFRQQTFHNMAGSQWQITPENHTQFRLNSPTDKINTLLYDSNDLRATYAYDDVGQYPYLPICSDLMARCYVQSPDSLGRIGISLSKYQIQYLAWVDSTGQMVISKKLNNEQSQLNKKSIAPPDLSRPVPVKFSNVDHRLIFEFGCEKLTYDMGREPPDAGRRTKDTKPEATIFGSGKLTLSHIAIFRDIHYTAAKRAHSTETGRATEGNPFTLRKDEFFVLGDNSPNSEDGRWWNRPGKANNGLSYRAGVVPRDYLVGKALLVYWPSGFKPLAGFPFGIIPNIGSLRFVHGGSNKVP